MATKKVNNANPLPIDPQALPDDGTPVTFSQTFAKHVGSGKVDDERLPTADDFEDAEWEIRRQTPDGWEFVERVENGMPLDNELREDYGPGKYELTPIDPRTGRLVKQVRKVRLISATITQTGSVLPFPGGREDPYYPPSMPAMTDEVPAWMRWQMQQAAEERAEQRRRAEEALARQKEFEEKLALREFERQEREERERKRRDDMAAEEARRRDERFGHLLSAGLGLAQAFFTGQNRNPQPQKDVNEVLLRELMEERRSRTPQANGMRDSLELLMVLDKLAESRAARDSRSSRDDDDDDDDSMKSLLVGMLPAMLGRGGGGGGAPQLPDAMVDQMIEQAFQNPAVIEKIAMRNPNGIAGAFMRAIKANPALEKAVLDAVEKSGDED